MDAEIGIVGAGPGGALAAQVLARAGASVLLLDGSHPREKPCGGGVTVRAIAEIEAVGAAPPSPDGITTVRRISFEDDRERVVPVDLDHADGSLIITSRRELDRDLLEQATRAGARFVPSRVTGVSVTRHEVEVRTPAHRYRVARLIGADGATSLVRRALSRRFTRQQLSLATGFFVHGASSRDAVVRFTTQPSGYLWSFPRPDHLAVGICAQADEATVEPLRQRTATWIREAVGQAVALTAYSWPIPSLSSRDLDRQQVAGDRWMLIGDAAGLVDPLTREGIYFALRAARHAADAVLAGTPTARDYTDRLRDDAYPELRLAARLKRGFFRPQFIQVLLDGLEQSEAVRDVMVDLVKGEQTYRTLVRRLLSTFELKLAWRLFRLGHSV